MLSKFKIIDFTRGTKMDRCPIFTCVGITLLGILLSQPLSAQVPSLLEAKGKNQECESFELWTGKAQELGGEDVIGGKIQSQNFVRRIAPAFADSVFEPLIGKSYAELSKSDKKRILKIVQRCLVEAGTPSFLPVAFDMSSRSNNSVRRDLLLAIENVTEADVQRAQQTANARTTKARLYSQNRPQRVARVIEGDPDAIKRQRLTDRYCYVDRSGFRLLYNDYVLDGDAIVKTRDERGFVGDQPCRQSVAMQRFVPNVTSLLLRGSGQLSNRTLLSIGNICGPNPEILFLSDHLYVELPKYGEMPPGAVRRGSPYIASMPYEFYVPTGSDGVLHEGIINSVEQGLLVTRQIVIEQCRPIPERIRVTGGTLRKDVGRGRFDRFQTVPEDLEYWEYYSGVFNPNEPGERLVHDDSESAATYAHFGAARREYVASRAHAESKRDKGFVVFGFMALAVIATYEMLDPCNDDAIEHQVKLEAGCYKPH